MGAISRPELLKFQKDYLDRTMNHSINLMAASDSNKKFLYIYAGFPESTHDQHVLYNSSLSVQLEVNYLKPYMMAPIRVNGTLDDRQINYNTKLSTTWREIKNAFGRADLGGSNTLNRFAKDNTYCSWRFHFIT